MAVMIAFTFSTCLNLILTCVSGLLKWLFTTPTAGDSTSSPGNEGLEWLLPTSTELDSTGDADHEGEPAIWPLNLIDAFRNKVTSTVACERGQAWHDLSDALLLGLSINQIVASISLWACLLKIYDVRSTVYRVGIVINMSAASALSQLSVPLVLRRPSYLATCMRLALCSILCAIHVPTFAVQFASTETGDQMISFLCCFLGTVLYLCTLTSRTKRSRESATDCDGCEIQEELHTVATLSIYYVSVIWHLYQALAAKYARSGSVFAQCSVNPPEDDEWTSGNILAVGMLVALVLPAFDIQSSKFQDRPLLEAHLLTCLLADSPPVNITAEEILLGPAFGQQGSDILTPFSPSISTDALPSSAAEHGRRVKEIWRIDPSESAASRGLHKC
ncbi:hypothetical protein D0869_12006 [Hortaea werneckii]|uniref:Uncharacterized protein n=1 Tax=Hortaea werneckii TaxID=91943 RepID=A0A3M6W958_HORWE|nr:hypothetical protein D0869_12006 [Hortaea werneckii]